MSELSHDFPSLRKQMKQLAVQLVRAYLTPSETIPEFDELLLATILEEEHGNICRAAKRAGLHRNTFSRRLRPEVIAKVKQECRRRQREQPVLRGLRTVPQVGKHQAAVA